MELRYAKLIIKDTSLPSKFNISSKVEDCVKTVIPDLPSLELELKSITRYDDLKAVPTVVTTSTLQNPTELRNAVTDTTSSSASSTNVSNADKITQLTQVTGLSKDECYFYLDMASWDLPKAVDMWEGLNRSSPHT